MPCSEKGGEVTGEDKEMRREAGGKGAQNARALIIRLSHERRNVSLTQLIENTTALRNQLSLHVTLLEHKNLFLQSNFLTRQTQNFTNLMFQRKSHYSQTG